MECQNSFVLGEKKNMNFPGVKIDLPTLTEQDLVDIREFGVKHADMIAASFIRRAADVKQIRQVLSEAGADSIKIISKIENQEGL